MDTGPLLFGILPLFLFVIMDGLFGLKQGLIAAVVLALLEASASLYYFHEIDVVTIFSIFLVFLLAFVSYYFKSSLYIKFQPVVLSAFLGLALIISFWMGKPLLLSLMTKYQNQMPVQLQANLKDPIMLEIFRVSTLYGGFALILHAILVAFAALKMSNWWWIAVRAVGFHVLFFAAIILAAIKVRLEFS